MKRIVACFRNNDYLSRVQNFCSDEKFGFVSIDNVDSFDNEPFIFMITDDKETYDTLVSKVWPLCFVSDEGTAPYIYMLHSSFGAEQLRMITDMVYHGCMAKNFSSSIEMKAFKKEFYISNDYFNIDKIVCAITADLALFISFSTLEKIRVGISEMITNAIEHGNLKITSKEKMHATESDTYYVLLNERLADPKLSLKKTYVFIEYDGEKLKFIIRDEGNGFDTSSLPDPTDQDSLLKLHGRGIFIARMYFDDITYNDKGNEVTLTKIL